MVRYPQYMDRGTSDGQVVQYSIMRNMEVCLGKAGGH